MALSVEVGKGMCVGFYVDCGKEASGGVGTCGGGGTGAVGGSVEMRVHVLAASVGEEVRSFGLATTKDGEKGNSVLAASECEGHVSFLLAFTVAESGWGVMGAAVWGGYWGPFSLWASFSQVRGVVGRLCSFLWVYYMVRESISSGECTVCDVCMAVKAGTGL